MLSAIWILSCNDENPIITYRGIEERLLVSTDIDIKSLVLGRRELFRPGVSKKRLDEWKARLRIGKALPSWLANIESENERDKAIDNLASSDVFRNQFRTEINSAPCDLKIVDWGLQHLERLRKAASELRVERLQKRSSLIAFVSVGLSTVVAIASLTGTFFVQARNSADQFAMKRYELSAKPRQESYSAFMATFNEVIQAALNSDSAKTLESLGRMESAYYQMEPFLGDKRQEVRLKFIDFSSFCTNQTRAPAIIGSDISKTDPKIYQSAAERVAFYKFYFSETLYKVLFLDVGVKS